MDSATPDESHATAILWRAGRNLQCFQQLEAALKGLLPAVRMQGTKADLERQLNQGGKALRKISLGKLSESYRLLMLDGERYKLSSDAVGDAAALSFTSTIDAAPAVLQEMRNEWRRIVRERNHLVHSMLIEHELKSSQAAAALIEKLDGQYEHASRLLDRLAHHRETLVFAASAFQALIESGQIGALADEQSDGEAPAT